MPPWCLADLREVVVMIGGAGLGVIVSEGGGGGKHADGELLKACIAAAVVVDSALAGVLVAAFFEEVDVSSSSDLRLMAVGAGLDVVTAEAEGVVFDVFLVIDGLAGGIVDEVVVDGMDGVDVEVDDLDAAVVDDLVDAFAFGGLGCVRLFRFCFFWYSVPHQLHSEASPFGPGSHAGVMVAPQSEQARFSLCTVEASEAAEEGIDCACEVVTEGAVVAEVLIMREGAIAEVGVGVSRCVLGASAAVMASTTEGVDSAAMVGGDASAAVGKGMGANEPSVCAAVTACAMAGVERGVKVGGVAVAAVGNSVGEVGASTTETAGTGPIAGEGAIAAVGRVVSNVCEVGASSPASSDTVVDVDTGEIAGA